MHYFDPHVHTVSTWAAYRLALLRIPPQGLTMEVVTRFVPWFVLVELSGSISLPSGGGGMVPATPANWRGVTGQDWGWDPG